MPAVHSGRSASSFRLVDDNWDRELTAIDRADDTLRIVCPFIGRRAIDRVLKAGRFTRILVITRFNLCDFASGVSETSALRLLLEHGAKVRGVRHLHAKLYVFGDRKSVVTSANLTLRALHGNHELGFVADEPGIVQACQDYFGRLWKRAGSSLTRRRLAGWERRLDRFRKSGGGRPSFPGLGDEGVDAGIPPSHDDLPSPPLVTGAPQAFVKFLGEGHNRAPLALTTLKEIERAGCHLEVAYPKSKRPRKVMDGATMFIGRLTSDPSDIRIFGRATAIRHEPGRDDATPEDIGHRSWRAKWSRYIRVQRPEFVAGTMVNGVSLNDLMSALGWRAFTATVRNKKRGTGNTDPRSAYRQQAAVELSEQGAAWLHARLDAAFAKHGRVPEADWPEA